MTKEQDELCYAVQLALIKAITKMEHRKLWGLMEKAIDCGTERKSEVENLIKKIKQLEPLNNFDCPKWVINVIKGEING